MIPTTLQALRVVAWDNLHRMSTFLLGVNYWPRRSAMYMWERFDLGEIREDMARIKGFGLELVRFFLRWDDFQPAPDRMDPSMLRRFDAMLETIADARLRALPTLFCGHMSGINWLPAWSLDPEPIRRNCPSASWPRTGWSWPGPKSSRRHRRRPALAAPAGERGGRPVDR